MVLINAFSILMIFGLIFSQAKANTLANKQIDSILILKTLPPTLSAKNKDWKKFSEQLQPELARYLNTYSKIKVQTAPFSFRQDNAKKLAVLAKKKRMSGYLYIVVLDKEIQASLNSSIGGQSLRKWRYNRPQKIDAQSLQRFITQLGNSIVTDFSQQNSSNTITDIKVTKLPVMNEEKQQNSFHLGTGIQTYYLNSVADNSSNDFLKREYRINLTAFYTASVEYWRLSTEMYYGSVTQPTFHLKIWGNRSTIRFFEFPWQSFSFISYLGFGLQNITVPSRYKTQYVSSMTYWPLIAERIILPVSPRASIFGEFEIKPVIHSKDDINAASKMVGSHGYGYSMGLQLQLGQSFLFENSIGVSAGQLQFADNRSIRTSDFTIDLKALYNLN